MQNEQEETLNQIISIGELMKAVTTVDLRIGKKLLFVTINASTYMRALALTQTPGQNIHAEPETTGWIDEFEGGAVLLDIGANVGTFSVYAAVVKKARVYAFEPSSPNFFLLNRNIQLNNINGLVTPFPIALSDESKIDFLYLPSLEIGGSGNSAGEDMDWLLQKRASEIKQGTVITTIDRLIGEGVIEPHEHIKMDVDGIEPKIIRGATELLSSGRVKSILIELTDQVPEHRKTIKILNDFGYQHGMDETEKNRVKDPAWKGLCNYIFRLGSS